MIAQVATLTPGPQVRIISHCEVFLEPGIHLVDETVVFVATSKYFVEKYFQRVRIEPGTWWRVECGRLDDIEGTVAGSVLYSRAGRVLKTSPVKQGYRAAIVRNQAWADRYLAMLKKARREGQPREEIENLERTLQSFRWRLRGHSL